MTRKELARHLHIDEGTLCLLDADEGKNFQKTMRKISSFLKSDLPFTKIFTYWND
jgi:hypothetical protein